MKAGVLRLATSVVLGVVALAGTVLVETPASAQVVRRTTTTVTRYRTRSPYSVYRRSGARNIWRRHHRRRNLRARRPFGDRDRDGVPNAFDRRPRNPNR